GNLIRRTTGGLPTNYAYPTSGENSVHPHAPTCTWTTQPCDGNDPNTCYEKNNNNLFCYDSNGNTLRDASGHGLEYNNALNLPTRIGLVVNSLATTPGNGSNAPATTQGNGSTASDTLAPQAVNPNPGPRNSTPTTNPLPGTAPPGPTAT